MNNFDFIEFLKQVNIMEEQRFWAIIALFMMALLVYLVKYKIKAKESTDVEKIKLKEVQVKEVSNVLQVGICAASIAFLMQK